MTENLTNPTALQCKKKFLTFIDALSNKYPPMTFREYVAADDNHTNWFPQRVNQSTEFQYQTWFTLAVLNNFPLLLRLKQQDPDALDIFVNIVKTDQFDHYVDETNYFNGESDSWELPPTLLSYVDNNDVSADDEYCFNANFDANINALIEYYNVDLQINNINKTSSAIRIKNNLIVLQQQHNLINELNTNNAVKKIISERNLVTSKSTIAIAHQRVIEKKIIYRKNKNLKKFNQEYNSISGDDIVNIYAFQVLSNSSANFEIIFSCSNIFPTDANVSKRYLERSMNADETLSLLTKNIGDCLFNS